MTIFSGTARLVEILASLIREISALWRYDPLVDDHRASEPFAREHVTLEPVITKFGQVTSTRGFCCRDIYRLIGRTFVHR